MKYFFQPTLYKISLILIILALVYSAQPVNIVLADIDPGTGPGGVGSTNGSAPLVLWLDANNLNKVDDDPVDTWDNQSGYLTNAVQSNTSYRPTFKTGILNNMPVVRFDSTNDYLQVDDYDELDNTSGLTLFSVISATFPLTGTFQGVVSKRAANASQESYDIYLDPSAALWIDINGSNDTPFTSSPILYNSGPTILELVYNGTLAAANRASLFDDGDWLTYGYESSAAIPNYASNLYIGQLYDGSTTPYFPYNGDIAEVIIYRSALNTAERILVENYLSSKYEIAIAAASDHYDGDIKDGNGIDFDFDVAGIGKEADGSNDTAYSVGMKVVNNTFLQDNGDYLLFGHNITSNNNTTSYIPWDLGTYPNAQRWTRYWYISVTDAAGTTGGTVDITFDFSDAIMGGSPGTASNYRLLKRSDTDTTTNFTELSYSATTSGDQITFSGVSVSDLGGRFTLGTLDSENSPTAIDLTTLVASSLPIGNAYLVTIGILLIASVFLIIMKKRFSASS